MFFTIPTLMTWTRIVAIPLIVGVYYLESLSVETQNLIATVMFVLFAITDWLDGFLARKLNQTSAFGAFLDPVADKFLVCAALLFGLAYLMWHTGGEFAVTGETTAQLKITKAPFIQGMGVLCGLTGLVHLTKAFWPGEEESSEGGTL